jgi:alpha-tubulin suppressor-like RCC1 family protein
MPFALGDWKNQFVSDYDMIDQYAGTGTLWTVGINSLGQLGDNTITKRSSPVQTVAGNFTWIFCDNQSGIKSDGTLWLWGEGTGGQIGNNSTANRSSPVQTVTGGTNWKLVSRGLVNTAAIKTDGTLWMWGQN